MWENDKVESKKKHKITTIDQVKVIGKKYSKLETMILTLLRLLKNCSCT